MPGSSTVPQSPRHDSNVRLLHSGRCRRRWTTWRRVAARIRTWEGLTTRPSTVSVCPLWHGGTVDATRRNHPRKPQRHGSMPASGYHCGRVIRTLVAVRTLWFQRGPLTGPGKPRQAVRRRVELRSLAALGFHPSAGADPPVSPRRVPESNREPVVGAGVASQWGHQSPDTAL